MTLLVADTCTLINFAAVQELDLLEATLRGRSHWTQAVEQETHRFVHTMPVLRPLIEGKWLGEALELDSTSDHEEVERLRAALGGTSTRPLEHLGEAESIRAILSRSQLKGAVLLTDDRDAAELAQFRGLMTWDTPRLLADAFHMGEVRHPAAYNILVRMRAAERGVRVPANCRDVCPA